MLALPSDAASTASHAGEDGPTGRPARTTARFLPPSRPSRDTNRHSSRRDLTAAVATRIAPELAESDSQRFLSRQPSSSAGVGPASCAQPEHDIIRTASAASGKASARAQIHEQDGVREQRKTVADRKVGGAAAAQRGQAHAAGCRASSGDAGSLAAEAMALCGLFHGVAEGAVSAILLVM
jgi:hypothetical protein